MGLLSRKAGLAFAGAFTAPLAIGLGLGLFVVGSSKVVDARAVVDQEAATVASQDGVVEPEEEPVEDQEVTRRDRERGEDLEPSPHGSSVEDAMPDDDPPVGPYFDDRLMFLVRDGIRASTVAEDAGAVLARRVGPAGIAIAKVSPGQDLRDLRRRLGNDDRVWAIDSLGRVLPGPRGGGDETSAPAFDNGPFAGVTFTKVDVPDGEGGADEVALLDGITHAARRGADALYITASFPPGYAPSGVLSDIIETTWQQGVMMVAAADRHDGVVLWPGASQRVAAIGVAAASDGARRR